MCKCRITALGHGFCCFIAQSISIPAFGSMEVLFYNRNKQTKNKTKWKPEKVLPEELNLKWKCQDYLFDLALPEKPCCVPPSAFPFWLFPAMKNSSNCFWYSSEFLQQQPARMDSCWFILFHDVLSLTRKFSLDSDPVKLMTLRKR